MNIRALTAIVATAGILSMAGCSAEVPATETSSSSTTSASATPTPTQDPVLLPEGSAKDNLYYFSWVIEQTLAADPAADSFAIAQAVGAAGFDPATVQFTFSRTAAGLAADTSDVAVQFDGQCLIGQFGPVAPKVIARVLPVLATGGCLLGTEVQSLG
ncbi:MAG: hypothetical protein RI926_530 [Actinomycetota bacterium]